MADTTPTVPGVPEGALNPGETGLEGVPKKPVPDGMDEQHGTPKEDGKTAKQEEKPADQQTETNKEDPAPAETGELQWAEMGNPAADSAIALLKEKGIAPEVGAKFFEKAMQTGNLEDIDVVGLEAAVGKSAASLIMMGARQYRADVVAQAEQNQNAAAEVVGGVDNLAAMTAWVQQKEGADPAFAKQLAEIRAIMKASPIGLKTGVKMLHDMYVADPKVKTGGNLIDGRGMQQQTSTITPMTREQYVEGMRKWSTKAEFGDPEAMRQVAALRAARAAAMGRR